MTSLKDLEEQIADLKLALAVASGAAPDPATIPEPDPRTPEVGDIVHVLAPLELAGSLRRRGEEVTVDAALLAKMRDRNGIDTLGPLLDEDYQMRRFGRKVIARGPFPDIPTWDAVGDPEWSRQYLEARSAARAIPDAEERADAERRLRARFGQVPADFREPPAKTRSKWAY